MVKFGVWNLEKYLQLGERRKFTGAHVAYNLLRVGSHPTADEIQAFEDIAVTLRTGNGTFRTTFRNRFKDVNAALLPVLEGIFAPQTALEVEDRAVSHGLTSFEWMQSLRTVYPGVRMLASDLLLSLWEYRLPSGEIYILEPDGKPLQYIKPPFVVSLVHREPRRFPANLIVALRARNRFKRLNLPSTPPDRWAEGSFAGTLSRIPFIHPDAAGFAAQTDALEFKVQSVFEVRPASCDVLRTMNILIHAYFSRTQLEEGIRAAFGTLRPGGVWVVGRSREEDLTNHVSFYQRGESAWIRLGGVGSGADIDEVIVNCPLGHG